MRCVTDANVWIDLDHGGLLGRVFDLGDDLLVPDTVLDDELLTVDGGLLVRLGLRVVGLSGDQLVEVSGRLALLYPRPSLRDLTSLVVARDAGIVLLTGDGALRKAAAEEDVEVHGVLWVLDRLVGEAGLSPPEAARSLRLMVRGGAWLPRREVEGRLSAWSA